MIVTKGTTQGDYADRYQVGVALSNCSNLYNDLQIFLKQDYQSYAQRCNELLSSFLKDQYEFEKALINFVS